MTTWGEHLNELWSRDGRAKTNWIELEMDLTVAFRQAERGEMTTEQVVALMDELMAAHLRRGNCLHEVIWKTRLAEVSGVERKFA